MAKLFEGDDVSHAWQQAASFLLTQPKRKASHLIVAVRNPLIETDGVREIVDEIFGDSSEDVTSTVERVADTIFPNDLYDPDEPDSASRFFERCEFAREFETQTVPRGNYFDHFRDYPGPKGSFNQLSHVITRLKGAKDSGQKYANRCEIGVFEGAAEARVQVPGKHISIMGFPCLSHVSVTLAQGRIDLAATYRAQDFTNKAYGNLLGLGRLANFFACETGFELGEVLCVATGAMLDSPAATGTNVRDIVSRVESLIEIGRGRK